jgi:hypothetical protein
LTAVCCAIEGLGRFVSEIKEVITITVFHAFTVI